VLCPLLIALVVTPQAVPWPMRFEGNVVLPDTVYAEALELPDDAVPDVLTADLVARQVQSFLSRTGYELAEVFVTVDPDGLTVHIDEGQLERLLFRGRLTVRMLRFRLALNLPGEVFNRPHLERELAERAQAIGIEPPEWELVEVDRPDHLSAQLDPIPSLVVVGRALIRPQRKYELHFIFTPLEWNRGVGLAVRTSWLNGLEVGVNWQGASVAMQNDRLRFALGAGAGLRRDLIANHFYVYPSILRAEARWFAPPVLGTRPFLQWEAEGWSRQRRDLGLESYLAGRTELSANVPLAPLPKVTLQLGAGMCAVGLGVFTPGPAQPLMVFEPTWRLRAFGDVKLELTLFDGGVRPDRRHALTLSGRVSVNLNRTELPPFSEARLNYQAVIPFGWHDLWFIGRATWLSGDVLLPFEESMAQHLPGVFGDVWLRKAIGLRVEFRYSLLRDVVKVGLFVKGLAWGDERGEPGSTIPRFGGAAGPGLHFLVGGLFQLDTFIDVAVLSNGRVGAGVQVRLNKVF
jgi:hypothetical protein